MKRVKSSMKVCSTSPLCDRHKLYVCSHTDATMVIVMTTIASISATATSCNRVIINFLFCTVHYISISYFLGDSLENLPVRNPTVNMMQ